MKDELSERTKLRERFVVAIVTGGILHPQSGDMPVDWVLHQAQALAIEAMKRREEDYRKDVEAGTKAMEALANGAKAMKDEPIYANPAERAAMWGNG